MLKSTTIIAFDHHAATTVAAVLLPDSAPRHCIRSPLIPRRSGASSIASDAKGL